MTTGRFVTSVDNKLFPFAGRTTAVSLIIISLFCWLGCGEDLSGNPAQLPIDVWEAQICATPPNRAPMARVEASSSRFGLLPKHGTSLFDLIPVTWPRLLPRFVQDGSLLTRWASAGNECPFLSYDFGNHTQEDVTIERIVLFWEEDVPSEFTLELSNDQETWKSVYQGQAMKNTIQEIRLDPAQKARWVRLRTLGCPVKRGISLYEISVYAPSDIALPPPIPSLQVITLDPHSVKLSWEPVPQAYCYRLYRLPGPNPFPHPASHLIAVTDSTVFLDQGLKPHTRYFYRIVPESFSGNLGASTIACQITTPQETEAEPLFQIRGVVEGFYNQPWSHIDRRELFSFMESVDMNFYMYAPKVEGYHRAYWREPYPDEELHLFQELIHASEAHGITFCYGLSPGMDFRWDDPGEINRILEKFEIFYSMGVRAFGLLFDDTPDTFASDRELAQRHVQLVREIYATLEAWGTEKIILIFVPTIYFKTIPELEKINPDFVEYLDGLSQIPPQVHIAWVGPGLPYSASILLEDAQEFSQHIGRKVLIWDNYPSNDNFFVFEPFLGPYRNRAPNLSQGVIGILSNPMNYPQSSMIPLFTFARYLSNPSFYDPDEAFTEAVERIGGTKGTDALQTLALQFYGHPIIPPTHVESPELSELLDAFWKGYGTAVYPEALDASLKQQFLSFSSIVGNLEKGLDNYALFQEIREPAQKLAIYGEAGLIALEILRHLHKEELGPVPELLNQLVEKMEDASTSPWRAGENYLHLLAALIVGSPPVRVDVISGFLWRTRHLAEQAVEELP